MESKNIKKSEQNTDRYLVTYFMKRTKGYGDQGRYTEVVRGDLEDWFKDRATNNPDYTIIIENSQYIW